MRDSASDPNPEQSEALMFQRIRRNIDEHGFLPLGSRVLVGVSGGVDSITLAAVLHRAEYDVSVAHVNYGLRGDESDKDEQCVRQFCADLGVTVFLSNTPPEPGGSIQEKARDIRYHFFEEVAIDSGIEYVAVAHNKNDQAETVLLNLHRGGGWDGLAGMRPIRPLSHGSLISLIRPMLEIRRVDVEDYARQQKLDWRDDASNLDCTYKRVLVRRKILPALNDLAESDVTDDIAAMAREFQRLTDIVLPGILPDSLQETRTDTSAKELNVDDLKSLDSSVRAWYLLRRTREWLPGAPIRASTVERLEDLLDSPVGKKVEYDAGTIWRERGHLKFVTAIDRVAHGRSVTKQSQADSDFISGPFGTVSWADADAISEHWTSEKTTISVDRHKIQGQLTIRPWQPGDRFQPFGMKGTKKVKSFLTDESVPSASKNTVHVLCDGENIIWVIGYRMDERYRINEQTKRVRHFSLAPVARN